MSDFPLRKRCKYVYCRRPFETMNECERYCCTDHRIAQTRYIERKRKLRKYQKAATDADS